MGIWGYGDPPLTPTRMGILRKIWQWRSDGKFLYIELNGFDIIRIFSFAVLLCSTINPNSVEVRDLADTLIFANIIP